MNKAEYSWAKLMEITILKCSCSISVLKLTKTFDGLRIFNGITIINQILVE